MPYVRPHRTAGRERRHVGCGGGRTSDAFAWMKTADASSNADATSTGMGKLPSAILENSAAAAASAAAPEGGNARSGRRRRRAESGRRIGRLRLRQITIGRRERVKRGGVAAESRVSGCLGGGVRRKWRSLQLLLMLL